MAVSDSSSFPPPKVITVCSVRKVCKLIQLVESDSYIMVTSSSGHFYSSHMIVYKVADLMSGRVVLLTCLGRHALVVGIERSLKGVPTISCDTIMGSHLSNDGYIGQYHLVSGT